MPLCRDIETDLRLHVHSAHLKGTVNVNPTKVLYFFLTFISYYLCSLKYADITIFPVKEQVTVEVIISCDFSTN